MNRKEYYILGALIIFLGSFSFIISAYVAQTIVESPNPVLPKTWQTIPLTGIGGVIMSFIGFDFIVNIPPKNRSPVQINHEMI